MRAALALALALAGCVGSDGSARVPTCASLGCPLRPSGSPDAWTPCDVGPDGPATCWCLSPDAPGDGECEASPVDDAGEG